MSVSAMNARLVLVAALLSSCSVSRETSDDRVETIQASAGEAVVLPCQINVPTGNLPTVEWSKEGPVSRNITFLYRHGFEIREMKNEDFEFRTSFVRNEVKDGNISLRISNVRPSDAGKHECSIFHGRHRKVVRTLELIVSAATEPKLSVVPCDVETLQFEVKSSLPQLNMSFLDHQEKVIDAEEPKHSEDSSGCFTFTGRVTLPTASDRVTCRVHQPHTNESRDAQIYFTEAECTKFCTVWSGGAVAVAAAAVPVVVALAVGFAFGYLFREKRYSNCAGRKIPLESNQPSAQSLDNQDDQTYQTDSTPTVASEHLRQPDQPSFDVSPSQPSPDTPNVSNSISENEPLRRSMSLSVLRPKLHPRRNTFSAVTQNRFSVLADLSEEQLLPS